MKQLKTVMARLKRELTSPEEEDVEDVESVVLAIESLLDLEKLSELDTRGLAALPEPLQQFYHALVYCQSIWDLYSTIASDGLLSVFYNDTGRQIERLKTTLMTSNDPAQHLFEEAYDLVHGPYDIRPDTNWVGRNRGQSPFDALSEDVRNRVEAIDNQLQTIQEASYEAAVASYQKARSQL